VSALDSFTSGRPIAVDVAAIEQELAGLWKSASTGEEPDATPAVTRACRLNLVVRCDGAEQAARATTVVAQVARVNPARVLMAVVEKQGAGGPRLEALITAHCAFLPMETHGRQVCCEQITITATADAEPRLPGALLSLLLHDLPVVIWWPGDPDLASPSSTELIEAADRVVVDSRRFSDAAARYAQLSRIERPVSDLAWHRMRPWRELTAGLFDRRMYDEYPQRLHTIEVEHAGAGQDGAEALMLACWTASRLKWGHAGGHDFTGPDGKPGRFVIRSRAPRDKEDPAGRILSLVLRAEGASFELRRVDGVDCVSVSASIPEASPVSRVARAVPRDDATLLSRAFENGARDIVYEETLRLAARVLSKERP